MKENDLTLADTGFELFLNKTNHVANAIHVHVQYMYIYVQATSPTTSHGNTKRNICKKHGTFVVSGFREISSREKSVVKFT
jgi:hypothetical protein